jgi:lipopolysaccharide export system permease protein
MIPEVALYVPFLVLAVMIAWMYRTLASKPGGQPIGSLERAASRAGKFIRSLLPQFGRDAAASA